MSSKVRSIKRQARAAQPPAPPIPDTEVIGIDHQFANEQMVTKYAPIVPVPLSVLKEAGFLLSHPAEFERASFGAVKLITGAFNKALDEAFRAAQERNIKETGKARP